MNSPTHEEISHRAHQLWREYGQPAGCDTDIWHTAERQLTAKASNTATESAAHDSAPRKNLEPVTESKRAAPAGRTRAGTATESKVAPHHPSPIPNEEAGKAVLQKHDARAPQVPHHTGPAAKPPETGKPLWNKPHSS